MKAGQGSIEAFIGNPICKQWNAVSRELQSQALQSKKVFILKVGHIERENSPGIRQLVQSKNMHNMREHCS